MRGKYVVAGTGQTAFGRLPGRSTISLNVEACRKALEDAGVVKSAIDGVFAKVPTSSYTSMYAQKLSEALGLQPRVAGVWDQGGAAPNSMIAMAAMAIEAGQCEVALIAVADDPKTGTRQAYERPHGDHAVYGYVGVAGSYALIAQRYKAEYGVLPEHFAAVAMACRRHGAANPNAQLRKPLTLDEYLAGNFVVEPFRRDDICLVSDGAAAVIVMSAKRARELSVPKPVSILGFGQGHTSWDVHCRPTLTSTAAAGSAATAFKMAGLGPRDIDVAQLYDCYSSVVLMTLEDYGFCPTGRAGYFACDDGIEIGGKLPVNTSGGLLSETGMPGMQLVIEGVRQMRGCSSTQVRDAATCIVSNQGGAMHTHSTLILGQ